MISNADAAAEADALLAEVAAAGESVVGQAETLIASADQLALAIGELRAEQQIAPSAIAQPEGTCRIGFDLLAKCFTGITIDRQPSINSRQMIRGRAVKQVKPVEQARFT